MNLDGLFHQVYPERQPYPYQRRFAESKDLPQLLSVATGVGKTATMLGGWIYRGHCHPNEAVRRATPRRLIYCLPMRVLVEQTYEEAIRWLDRLGLLAGSAEWKDDKLREYTPDTGADKGVGGWAADHGIEGPPIGVHLLMGGEDAGDWDLHPDRDAILIGTQDMLLSRALNRGYGMSRYRWPVHFGLLNNDCLWVFDETQLMGVGVTTSAQLQGLRAKLSVYGSAQSLWMSATLNSSRLSTVDHPEPDSDWRRLELGDEDRRVKRVQKLIEAVKPCKQADIVLTPEGNKSGYPEEVAAEIVQLHREGTLTLAVVNRVDRAQEIRFVCILPTQI